MEIKELVNKNDYINVLKDIVRPAIGFFDEKESCVSLPGYYATSYDDSVLQLESFSDFYGDYYTWIIRSWMRMLL